MMAMMTRTTPALVMFLSLLVIHMQVQLSQPCLCSILRNFKCPSPPACCESGQYTLDECGCCQKCAKAELQKCGGASDISGKCAGGLQCLKTCLPCKTVGDAGRPCVFPFKYRDVTYDKCTSRDSDNGQPWCATEVDDEGYVVDNAWGDCLEGCPGSRLECDDKYFSIQEGKCIDISVPGAIPNWFGAPAVKLESPTRDLFTAPACKSKKGTVRFYDNTCRCVRGESAIDLAHNGQIRGNCTGLEDDDTDNLDKVWCFLENIRDPLNPSSGCYSDTKWSERDARFWSSLACFQAPDIEGGERASVNNRGFSNSIDRSYRPTKKPSTRPPTTTTTSTTTTTTTTRLALGEIEQYTDGEEHFYFSEYYQDYQDNIDDNSRQFDYNDGNQDNPSNNDVANPTMDDKSYTFIIGETNIPGFGREDEQQEGPVEQQTTTPEPLPQRQIGPFLPTPSPIVTTTSNRRKLLRNRFKNRNRSRRPPNANPRRRPPTPAPNKRVLATRFPNFRRRPQILRRTTERHRITTTTSPARDSSGKVAESPRSFLEGEFGENNIPIAIPLFENGELSDDIFKKIKKQPNSEIKNIPLPPDPPFGSVLAKVETETIKVNNGKGKSRKNILDKIPTEKAASKPNDELQDGLLDLFGDIDVGLNEVMSDDDLNKIDIQPEPPSGNKNENAELPTALPLILEEEPAINTAIDGTASLSEDHEILIDKGKHKEANSNKPGKNKVEAILSEDHKIQVDKNKQKEADSKEASKDEVEGLADPITTIPNVFKYLPTLSTGRRDNPALNTQETKPGNSDSKQNKEGIPSSIINTPLKPDTIQDQELTSQQKINNSPGVAEKVKISPVIKNTQISEEKEKDSQIRNVKNISTTKSSLIQDQESVMVKTSTSISISKTVERHIEIKDSDTIRSDSSINDVIVDNTDHSDNVAVVIGTPIDSTTIKSDTNNQSDNNDHDSGGDTALVSDTLKNLVRSGITNQENVDKKAITEELKNIVRSGILDLGILGLWSQDPLPPSNTSPRPVFRPSS